LTLRFLINVIFSKIMMHRYQSLAILCQDSQGEEYPSRASEPLALSHADRSINSDNVKAKSSFVTRPLAGSGFKSLVV